MAAEGIGARPGPAATGGDLAALLRYEREQATQPLLGALLERRLAGHPAEIGHAAQRVLEAHAPWALDLAGSATKLVERAGDERRVRLFRAWAFGRRSLEDVARQEGILRQGASWNVHQADARIRRAAATAAPWPWLIATTRRHLGALTAAAALDALVVRLGITTAAEAELLTWLAGPYRPVAKRPGWLAVDPRPVVSQTLDCLGCDGGVRRRADVEAELADLDIRADQLVAWLAANGSAVVHDLAVQVTGPLADAVERVLDAHGAPRTLAQIGADLAAGGRSVEPAALQRAVQKRDRFTRSGPSGFGLVVWGPDHAGSAPPATGRSARRARPPAAQGRTKTAPAPAEPGFAGPAPAPAKAARGRAKARTRTAPGPAPTKAARTRTAPGQAATKGAPDRAATKGVPDRAATKGAPDRAATKGAPRRAPTKPAPATPARLWLWLRVDEEVLRGAEAAVPAALVEGLGLGPLTRRTFSSRWGPVTLAHDGAQPTRGSVRAIALAAGANPDDTLLLGFSAAGDVSVELRRGPAQVSPPGPGAEPLVLFPELEFAHGGTP